MATARELLDQADALMRRNRAHALDDIPVLTEAVPAAQMPWIRPASPRDEGPESVPVLTDTIEVVEDDDAIEDHDATVGREAVEGEPSIWLEFEDDEPSVIGDAPDSIAIVPPVQLRAAPDDELLASAEHEEIELTIPREESVTDSNDGDAAARTEATANQIASVEAHRFEAADVEAARIEAARVEAEQVEAARVEA
ncbi:MAG: hypothetical protein ABI777_09225, partial [Betaproteobacteria bacterium]